jgi:glutathione synthase/RimK-type ligase-like ATP-grasp enzyme
MKSPEVLLVTTQVDITADYVVLALERVVARFFRLNTDQFPLQARFTFSLSNDVQSALSWSDDSHQVNFDQVRAVWFRRVRTPEFPDYLDRGLASFCSREASWFLRGAFLALQPTAWMNYPAALYLAESKLLQLRVARDVGFRVPDTAISNDVQAALKLLDANEGQIVAKPVRMGFIDYGDYQTSIYTNLVRADDLRNAADEVRLAPVIFQELIPKRHDVRVTIVGENVFSALIHSQAVPSARIDWRATDTGELVHEAHELPDDVAAKCLHLLSHLNLAFGALDLILTPDGEYVFLEVNPSGQWAWLEDRLGFPISDEIAHWLVNATR